MGLSALTIQGKTCNLLFVHEQKRRAMLGAQGGWDRLEKDCGAWINLLSRKVKRRLNATLQGVDITFIQSQVIFYILNHWQEAPVFQRDIEQVFSLSRSTATGILQQLEEKRLLRRESVESDARLKSLVPTGRAAQLDAEVRACLRQTEEVLTRGLSGGQVQLFKETLAAMAQNLDDAEAENAR